MIRTEMKLGTLNDPGLAEHSILVVDGVPESCSFATCSVLSRLTLPHLSVSESWQDCPSALLILRLRLEPAAEAVVRSLRQKCPVTPIVGVFCAGPGTAADLHACIRQGLTDYVMCPFTEMDILARLHRLLPAEGHRSGSRPAEREATVCHYGTLVGGCPAFLKAVHAIPTLAASEATILITGETGTGKELFARAIHYHSARRGHPFVPINCSALPDHLFENELFGHTKGAYTDAAHSQPGLIGEAEGGTLFLDEIDTLSATAQAKLLRFVQHREYRPLGSSKTAQADVRLIAATNANLRAQVSQGRFREDLFHRLNIFHLDIAPLRERVGDIPLLVSHYLHRFASEMGRPCVELSPHALQKLLVYAWPGNVRELEGVLYRATTMAESPVLSAEALDLWSDSGTEVPRCASLQETKRQAADHTEHAYLIRLLTTYYGNISHAAKAAQTNRRTFQRLLQKHQLDRQTFRPSPMLPRSSALTSPSPTPESPSPLS